MLLVLAADERAASYCSLQARLTLPVWYWCLFKVKLALFCPSMLYCFIIVSNVGESSVPTYYSPHIMPESASTLSSFTHYSIFEKEMGRRCWGTEWRLGDDVKRGTPRCGADVRAFLGTHLQCFKRYKPWTTPDHLRGLFSCRKNDKFFSSLGTSQSQSLRHNARLTMRTMAPSQSSHWPGFRLRQRYLLQWIPTT